MIHRALVHALPLAAVLLAGCGGKVYLDPAGGDGSGGSGGGSGSSGSSGGPSCANACEQLAEACPEVPSEQCAASCFLVDVLNSASGCGSEYAAILACALDHTDGCDISSACDAETQAYLECVVLFCSKMPTPPVCLGP